MKVLFAKYTFLTSKANYFDRAAQPIVDDVLVITKHIKFPRVRKQLTSPEDFSQIEYGDAEMILSLLNNEISENEKTITQFFDEFVNYSNTDRLMKMLCILDSGYKRWAGFVALPFTYDYSYGNSDAFTIKVKAFDAMAEWKSLAETLIPSLGTGGVGNGNFFDEYMTIAIMGPTNFPSDALRFQNDTGITSQARINKPLLAGIQEGGNTNFTVYNLVKDLAVSWGLVYKFEVPVDYETKALAGRVPLTFRLMKRLSGNTAIMKPKDHFRTSLPRVNESWVFLMNRRYTVRTNFGSTFGEADIAHGVLTNGVDTYNFDAYDMSVPRSIPTPSFILGFVDINSQGRTEDPVYKDKVTVIDGGIVKQIPIKEVRIIENILYNLEMHNNYQAFVNSKKFGGDVYIGSQAYERINNQMAAHRIFCSSYSNWNGEEPGLDDVMYLLNNLPASELRVQLKNKSSVKGITSIMSNEPDLFDTFSVPYNGVDELHSIIAFEPNYNINDGEDSLTAEYQTARID